MKENFKQSLRILRKKISTLKKNLKNKRFMISIPVEIILNEFEKLADEALALTFKSKEHPQLSKDFYDLHETCTELSRTQPCAA
jgi:hypothetical protein